MPTPTDVAYFRRHTYSWVKPPPGDTPLENQAELFRRKDTRLRRSSKEAKKSNGNTTCSAEANMNTSTSLGELAAFPLEILHMILWRSDLQSLANFRCLNRYCLSIVESLPAYKLVETQALKAYRAILLIRSARFISLGRLCNTIGTATCDTDCCTNFAPYIYLVSCMRACEVCVGTHVDFYPLPLYNAVCLFGLGKSALLQVPHMLPWQGIDKDTGKRTDTDIMVDYRSALAAGLDRHGSEEAMVSFGRKIFPEPGDMPRDQKNWYYSGWKHEQDASNRRDPKRWWAICSVPCVSWLGSKPPERRCCRTCDDRLLYTKEEFARHVDDEDEASGDSSAQQAVVEE